MIIDVPLNIKLHKNQEIIHQSKAKNVIVEAGKRFGKTSLAVYKIVKAAGAMVNGIFWYLAPTFGQAKNIVWEEMGRIIPRDLIQTKLAGDDLSIKLKTGSLIKLMGCENQDRTRGPGLNGVVFEEADYIDPYIWNNIIRGQLLGSGGQQSGWSFFISSLLNPMQVIGKKIKPWFHDFYLEALRKKMVGDKDWDAFHFEIWDNPLLDRKEIKAIENDSTEDEWNVEYLALPSSYTGQVYSEFQFNNHVKEYEIKNDFIFIRGIDWGLDHPTVCLFVYIDMNARSIYFDDEFSKSNFTIEESCDVIKKITGDKSVEWTVCDPSLRKRNPVTKIPDGSEFVRNGVNITYGDNNSRGYSIAKMYLKKNMVYIHPRCKNLIRQLKDLQWTSTVNDDCTDVFRYICLRINDLYFRGIYKNVEDEKQEKNKPIEYSLNDPNLFPNRFSGQRQSKIMQEANDF